MATWNAIQLSPTFASGATAPSTLTFTTTERRKTVTRHSPLITYQLEPTPDGSDITPGYSPYLTLRANINFVTADIGGQAVALVASLWTVDPETGNGTLIAEHSDQPRRDTAGALDKTWNIYQRWRNLMQPETEYRIQVDAYRINPNNGARLALVAQRWTTILTNRRPAAPVITTPNNTIISYDAGAASWLNLQWVRGDDADATGSVANAIATDYAGWQIQGRPKPTATNPNPAWKDYPVDAKTSAGTREFTASPRRSGSFEYLYGAYWLAADDLGTWLWASDDLPSSGDLATRDSYSIIFDPGSYEFRVRQVDWSSWWTRDSDVGQDQTFNPTSVSEWSDPVTIVVDASFLPPTPVSPIFDVAVFGTTVRFEWLFRDPRITGGTQLSRRVRVRKVGDTTWTEIIPSGQQTSPNTFYDYANVEGAAIVFQPGFEYEWQAKTVSTPGNHESTWGEVATFWFIPPPGDEGALEQGVPYPGAELGCGKNEVYLFHRGGLVEIGHLANATKVNWTRVRDDISQARITFDLNTELPAKCRGLLAEAATWLHELVIFRDNGSGPVRVWEGPITTITHEKDRVTLIARDPMVWVYRRILRQGYNDSFRVVGRKYNEDGDIIVPGVVVSQPLAVTLRAQRIIQNALAYDDPNVLKYLTVFYRPDDAKESRIIADWSRLAWEEVDDLAAKSGLDYTTIGRRIVLWDTHTPIGVLPEMRDEDFDNPIVVTEYGMQAANVYGVSSNTGLYGTAERPENRDIYGFLEMLSSAYGEDDEAGSTTTLTAEARERLIETLTEQADRNIASRWPVPYQVRVPDNSALSPSVALTINQLVPGVQVPLRSTSTYRSVAQVQKLDKLDVTEEAGVETVKVTLGPSPRSRDDNPDEGTGGGEE